MHPDEAVLQVVRGWMLKAESDLENATLVLRAGPDGPMDTVSFHAQQCAEKCLKALLCFRGQEVPRNHDIELLLARTGIGGRVDVTLEESRLLTDYATVTRYPGDYEPVSYEEAAYAVDLAVRIRAAARRALPEGLFEIG
jgi:HEPN domain-containing protein